MTPFTFHNPVIVNVGPGCLQRLPSLCPEQRVLLVTTKGTMQRGLGARVCELLSSRTIQVTDAVQSNPDLLATQALADSLRMFNPEVIVALGGGSALDSAKALSVCLAANADWKLENFIVHQTSPAPSRAIPIIAIPTTAGTGAEVTPFATLWDHAQKRKLSLATPIVYPRSAIVDSQLLLGTPRETLISCGLDALSQALESVWNRNAQPITRLMATRAVPLALAALPLLSQPTPPQEAFDQIMEASLLAGLCISQTRTALAHSMSYPLTARFGVPHGLACGFTLGALLRFNLAHDHTGTLQAFAEECGIGNLQGALDGLMQAVSVGEMVRHYLPHPEAALEFTHEMLTPGRADNNLCDATPLDIAAILRESFSALGLSEA